MSAKNRDNKNRWRNITVGFRVCLLDLFLLTEYFLCVNTEKLLHILFHSANSCNAEVLDQDLCNIRA